MLNSQHDNVRASVVYRRIANDERTNQVRGFAINQDKFSTMSVDNKRNVAWFVCNNKMEKRRAELALFLFEKRARDRIP